MEASPAEQAAATAIAAANEAHDAAVIARHEAHEGLAEIEERLAEKVEAREAIRARRAAGDARDDDAGELSVIEMDAAELAPIAAERRQAVADAEAALARANSGCTSARAALAEATALANFDALAGHALAAANKLRAEIDLLTQLAAAVPPGQAAIDRLVALADLLLSSLPPLIGAMEKLQTRGRIHGPPTWAPNTAAYRAIHIQASKTGRL